MSKLSAQSLVRAASHRGIYLRSSELEGARTEDGSKKDKERRIRKTKTKKNYETENSNSIGVKKESEERAYHTPSRNTPLNTHRRNVQRGSPTLYGQSTRVVLHKVCVSVSYDY